MKRLIVGDIHACFDEFMALIEAAGITDEDEIYPLGDIVDRGLYSKEVIQWCMRQKNVFPLMGNHERKHIKAMDDPKFRLAPSQLFAKAEFTDQEYIEAVNYMRTFRLYVELPEAVLVHGLYEPGVPLQSQREDVLVGTIGAQKYLERKYPTPWYEMYDGEKPIIVGHLVYLRGEPLIREGRVYGLDTASCHGLKLTGMLLPGFKIISVPSKKDYWVDKVKMHNGHVKERKGRDNHEIRGTI